MFMSSRNHTEMIIRLSIEEWLAFSVHEEALVSRHAHHRVSEVILDVNSVSKYLSAIYMLSC